MIKLKSLLAEFEFGNIPFSDGNSKLINTSDRKDFKSFLKKWSYELETNTADENLFLKKLITYINSIERFRGSQAFVDALKSLLPLKSKFPGILDPKTSNDHKGMVYRGTTIPIKTLIKQKPNIKSNYIEFNTNTKLKSKGNRNFLSFSVVQSIAEDFTSQFGTLDQLMEDYMEKGLVPAIIGLDISNPNLILNPDFLVLFNSYGSGSDEGETFYIGKSLTVNKILVPINNLSDYIVKYINDTPYKKEYEILLTYLPKPKPQEKIDTVVRKLVIDAFKTTIYIELTDTNKSTIELVPHWDSFNRINFDVVSLTPQEISDKLIAGNFIKDIDISNDNQKRVMSANSTDKLNKFMPWIEKNIKLYKAADKERTPEPTLDTLTDSDLNALKDFFKTYLK